MQNSVSNSPKNKNPPLMLNTLFYFGQEDLVDLHPVDVEQRQKDPSFHPGAAKSSSSNNYENNYSAKKLSLLSNIKEKKLLSKEKNLFNDSRPPSKESRSTSSSKKSLI